MNVNDSKDPPVTRYLDLQSLTPLLTLPIIRFSFESTSIPEGAQLTEVRMAEGETFDSLLRRFNKRVQTDGILSEIRRRQHFEPPTVKRKKKEAAKRRKSMRNS